MWSNRRWDIDILGFNKLKWTRMGEFNSDDPEYLLLNICYCGQESLRRNVVALIANKRTVTQYMVAISKTTE